MRLFVAVDIPQAVRDDIAVLIQRLKCPGPKWVEADNLHLTLKFIGESNELEGISRVLSVITGPPITVGLKGLGSFPRVLWIGVKAPPELASLARRIDQALIPLGISSEQRAFSPHLTLARMKDGRMPKFDEQPDFGTFPVSEFVLYQSRLSSAGPSYTPLRRFPLVEPARSA